MEDVDLEERIKRFGKLDEDEDEIFMCDCGSVFEDRIHMMGEFPLY